MSPAPRYSIRPVAATVDVSDITGLPGEVIQAVVWDVVDTRPAPGDSAIVETFATQGSAIVAAWTLEAFDTERAAG